MAEERGIPRRLGHVALRVRDLDRAIEFYTRVLGLELRNRHPGGPAFLKLSEDSSHELALFELPPGAAEADPTRAGMYHAAWLMPSFESLAKLHDRLLANDVDISGYSSSAARSANVMFFDPDGNEHEALWEPSEAELAAFESKGEPVPTLRAKLGV